MKKKEIPSALEALKKIKMPAIENKELRNGIITDHLKLVRENKKYEEKVKELDTVHLGAYEDERKEVADLQRDLQAEKDVAKQVELAKKIEGHKDLFDAIKSYNKAVEEIANEEVEIGGIPEAAFLEEIQKQDFDLGQIEALEPMFI